VHDAVGVDVERDLDLRTPRGAGGMPTRSNWPRSLLSAAISRSPWKTRIVTADWLSAAVEKTWLFAWGWSCSSRSAW
jgi:hypothetical protein